MKYLFTLLLLTFTCGCSAPKLVERPTTSIASASTHKMASYFQSSKGILDSVTVNQLIQAALKDPSKPEALYSLGYLHMQHGISGKNVHELELAEAYLNEVLTQFPGNQLVLQALYNIYYDNTLHNRNENAFNKAKITFMQLPETLHSNMNPPSLAKFGAMAAQQEREHQPNRQALRELLLEAIHESPQTDIPYIQLARFYSEDRYFALAIATLKLGAENISNSTDLYQAIADTYTKRADVNNCNYEHPSDIRNAGKYYQLAIPLNPNNQALHFALSQSFLDQNLNQLGLNEAKVGLDIKHSKESSSLNAQTFSTLGYHTQALSFLQQALALGYSVKDAGYHEIYMNQGDWTNAAVGFTGYIKNREKFSVYDLIKSDIIAQQAQLQPWLISQQITVSNSWEQALLNYWNARISADNLKKLANTNCEKTEYYFYTGYKDLQTGNRVQANSKFSEAINQNTYRFIERPLARYFLERN